MTTLTLTLDTAGGLQWEIWSDSEHNMRSQISSLWNDKDFSSDGNFPHLNCQIPADFHWTLQSLFHMFI